MQFTDWFSIALFILFCAWSRDYTYGMEVEMLPDEQIDSVCMLSMGEK